MSNPTVRLATRDDKEWVVTVAAKNMLNEEAGRPEYYSYEDCAALFDLGMATGVILIAEKDGQPVGCISGLLHNNIFNKSITTLAEIFWYVLPEHRNGKAGLLLLNTFSEMGKQMADEIYMSLLDKSDVSHRMMERKGYTLREVGYYLKRGT